MKKVVAVYAGSFDPLTHGHEDIIRRAAKMFEHVVVAIGVNPKKVPLFSPACRTNIIRHEMRDVGNVSVDSFGGLLIDYCHKVGARVIIRGLRAVSDFEQELMLAQANGDLAPGIETVWLPTKPQHSFISSSMVREIASHKGDVNHYVSAAVARDLKNIFAPPAKPVSTSRKGRKTSRG